LNGGKGEARHLREAQMLSHKKSGWMPSNRRKEELSKIKEKGKSEKKVELVPKGTRTVETYN